MLTKKYKALALSFVILGLATCSVPASGDTPPKTLKTYTANTDNDLMSYIIDKKAIYDAKVRLNEVKEKARLHTERINLAINDLEQYVGKTWYVFSGSSPKGWDCSGLTKWFYGNLGIELEHRASKQSKAGKKVYAPLRGDLVVFRYSGSGNVYHVGVYTGDDMMIHAPREGKRTSEESISEFAGNHSKVEFVRLITID